jgi:hypothetical protein
MPKPSKIAIELSLTEWLSLKMKAMKISAQCAADTQPFKETFEKKCKPFVEEANQKLQPINERLALLSSEIEKEFRKGVDEDAGSVALAQVLIGKGNLSAIAEILKEDGDRVIDAQKFFEVVKQVDRTPSFWACLKVQIGKAEKFLGDKINELAKKPKVFRFKISIPELEQQKQKKAA